ncbi:MAG: hypothetical protein F6K19_12340, partial [Cyanothece sp. SIO1E1]|nr:hypothetical protein [Cyanothece sp. SIO1E1]
GKSGFENSARCQNLDEADYQLPVWAGELPLRLATGPAISDPRLAAGITLPAYIGNYSRDSR